MRKHFILLVLLGLAASAAHGDVVFTNLGTAAPPTTLGGVTVTPYDQAPQAAIPNFTSVTSAPGGPGPTLFSVPLSKRTIGAGWATWSHGYTGVVYASSGTTVTITLPYGTAAFYLYAEPNQFASFNVTATTDAGTTSGPITVNGSAGANGFGFHTTASESIVTITVTTADTTGMAIGEFGAALGGLAAVPAASTWGLAALALAIAAAGLLLLRGRLVG